MNILPTLALTVIVGVCLSGPAIAGKDHQHGKNLYGMPGDPKKVTRTIKLDAKEIAFNTDTIKVKKDETIRFILNNKGVQNHEFTIGDAASQNEHRKMMETMTMEDMQKMGHKHDSSVDTKPGQTKELVWTFTHTGTFDFACNYPGHAAVGMQGKIVVQ